MMASTLQLHPATRGSRFAPGPPVDGTANDGLLPLDLLYDILLRLSAKSICRFRAVCTSWHSLLCHPDFIAAAQPDPRIAVGVCHDGPSNVVVSVLHIESGDVLNRVSVVATSQHPGSPPPHETCAVSPDRAVCVVGKDGRLCLIDPATGAVKLLPFPPSSDHKFTLCMLGTAAFTGGYKVLAITNSIKHSWQICKILTLDGNGWEQSWRETWSPPFNVVLPLPPWTYNREVAVVEGVAYFLVAPYHVNAWIEPNMHHARITAFDLENEVWQPPVLRGPPRQIIVTLATLQGQLVACHEDRRTYELWFLVDPDQVLWSMQHRIVMPYLEVQSPPATSREYFVKPLAVIDDWKIVVWMRVAAPGFGSALDAVMRYYDLRTGAFTDGMQVTKCNDVSVLTWSMLYSGRGGRRAALKSY